MGRSRDEEFTGELERIRPRAIAYCRHMLWNREELDDVLQTAIAIAYQSFTRFESGSSFQAWFFRICTNVVHNSNRRGARETDRFMPATVEELDIVAELEREYAYEELLRHPERVLSRVGDEMNAALMSLTLPERTVFLLKTIVELSCREIASTLEMPMGSVMGYLTRARGKLRHALSEYAKKEGILRSPIVEKTPDGLPQS
ncbi:MAG: RNA polymerase sigma factor [candidate division Zixibacteria bacterium]|nr:RNA polymerase sigma factor [candidate division Zixibacteria bacterium]